MLKTAILLDVVACTYGNMPKAEIETQTSQFKRALMPLPFHQTDLDAATLYKARHPVHPSRNCLSHLGPSQHKHGIQVLPFGGPRPQIHTPAALPPCILASPSDEEKHTGVLSRRSMLQIATAGVAMPFSTFVLPRSVRANPDDPKSEIESIFQEGVRIINEQLGGTLELKTKLLVFGEADEKQFGLSDLSDPAKDYTDADCGEYLGSKSSKPYELCPDSDDADLTDLQRQCCRHLAFTIVPSKFFVAKGVVQVEPVVVVSPRIRRLPVPVQRAVVWHELGHVSDFVLLGSHYNLVDRDEDLRKKKKDPAVKERVNNLLGRLTKLDCDSTDPEERADNLANLLVAEPTAEKLCYEKRTLVQTLIKSDISGQTYDGSYQDHYPHDPLEGEFAKLDFKPRAKCKIV
eukprot:gnl/MRDRNA2_/MRDRNA2_65521_c0_seq1.p1 gnl/MRDRNA2_/MRDRNA2_65521_c0~~gnl/MRDRNA2_/MRDRNA2_65521_c0_seq1.p1  ORF type:complete len:404 (+),score=69.62 gnl/MRDRNA2_/MRDRNA2_65521_c0_seq1:79-1290(+)